MTSSDERVADLNGSSSPVRHAVPADVPSWLVLAERVTHLFGPMPGIQSVIERGIVRGTALVTGPAGSISAGMLLSRDDKPHHISWLAVAPEARGRGLGTALVHAAIARWPTDDIDVITFGPDVAGGEPARRLYSSAGFVLAGAAEPAENGGSRQRFVLHR